MVRAVLHVPSASGGDPYVEAATMQVWLARTYDAVPIYHDASNRSPRHPRDWNFTYCGRDRYYPPTAADAALGVRFGTMRGVIVPLRLVHAAARPCRRCWP